MVMIVLLLEAKKGSKIWLIPSKIAILAWKVEDNTIVYLSC